MALANSASIVTNNFKSVKCQFSYNGSTDLSERFILFLIILLISFIYLTL